MDLRNFKLIFLLLICQIYLSYASDTFEEVQRSYFQMMERFKAEEKSNELRTNKEKTTQNDLGLNIRRGDRIDNHVASRAPLFHALNASISTISHYIAQVQNDQSLEWVYNNKPLYDNEGNKFSLTTFLQIHEDGESTIPVISCSQLYEVERQKICFDLTFLWNLIVSWKKNIFPDNSLFSYHSTNARALKVQIHDLYQRRLSTINEDRFNSYTYEHTIVDLLAQIFKSIPTELIVKNHDKNITKSTRNKVEILDKDITEKQKRFNNCYIDYYEIQSTVVDLLTSLQKSYFKEYTDSFVQGLKSSYQSFQSFKFPGEQKPIRFVTSPLNFKRLKPSSICFSLIETPKTEQSTLNNLPPIISEQSPEFLLEISRDDPEEEIVYDAAYWQEQNKYHAERKKAAQSPQLDFNVQMNLSVYEYELYAYLNEKIYKYVRRTGREFIRELKDLKFKVVPNNSGKGSVHYVYPAENNPLFGLNSNYARAYFNLHLPHDDGDIIPSGYFDFAQSGFGNVFGLTLENIQAIKK